MQNAALRNEITADTSAGFMAFAADQETASTLMGAAAQAGHDDLAVVTVQQGVDEILSALSAIPTPEILMVDFSGSDDLLADVTRLAGACDPGSRVIVIGDVNDVNVYRRLIEDGIHEYLIKPLTQEGAVAAIESAGVEPVSLAPMPAAEPEMKCIAFVGAHGGAGTSTTAANCAWSLSTHQGLRVSLIDLDLSFGTLALQMDSEPGKGLVDALMTPSRVDELFLKRALVPLTESLHVLASEADLANAVDINADAVGVLFDHMKGTYDAVVIDLPRHVLVRQSRFLTLVDEIVLVAEPTLVGLRDTSRLAKLIREQKPDVPLRIVLNRIGLASDAELDEATFAKSVSLEIAALIPFDAKAAARAAAKGQVMVAADKKSKVSKALNTFAADLLLRSEEPDGTKKATSGSLWSRLRKRG